jgi:hypothetical protein
MAVAGEQSHALAVTLMVEPFGQIMTRACRLVGKLQIFSPRLEILRWLCPSPRPRPKADYR